MERKIILEMKSILVDLERIRYCEEYGYNIENSKYNEMELKS